MAGEKGKSGPTLRMDEFVSKLVTDPKQLPNTLLLGGYVGASSLNDHVRLYFDAQLTGYVEVPVESILHAQEIGRDQSMLGGSIVWVKRDAALIYSMPGEVMQKTSFLEGQIQQDFLGGLLFPFVTCAVNRHRYSTE